MVGPNVSNMKGLLFSSYYYCHVLSFQDVDVDGSPTILYHL